MRLVQFQFENYGAFKEHVCLSMREVPEIEFLQDQLLESVRGGRIAAQMAIFCEEDSEAQSEVLRAWDAFASSVTSQREISPRDASLPVEFEAHFEFEGSLWAYYVMCHEGQTMTEIQVDGIGIAAPSADQVNTIRRFAECPYIRDMFRQYSTRLLDRLRPEGIWFVNRDRNSDLSIHSLAEYTHLNELAGEIEWGYRLGRFGGHPAAPAKLPPPPWGEPVPKSVEEQQVANREAVRQLGHALQWYTLTALQEAIISGGKGTRVIPDLPPVDLTPEDLRARKYLLGQSYSRNLIVKRWNEAYGEEAEGALNQFLRTFHDHD